MHVERIIQGFAKHRTSCFSVAVILLYSAAPAIFFFAAHNPNWGEFWKAAATPYGTVTAGFAAITAASLALKNGREDRLHKTESELPRDLDTRYMAAVSQLSNKASIVRLSGVHNLYALSNEWRKLRTQGGESARPPLDALPPSTTATNTLNSQQAYKAKLDQVVNSVEAIGEVRAIRSVLKSYLMQRRRDSPIDERRFPAFDEEAESGEHAVRLAVLDTIRKISTESGDHLIDLRSVDLHGLRLERMDFQQCFLSGADMSYTVLTGSNFSGTVLSGANLTGSRASGAIMQHAHLNRATLTHTNLRGARLEDADIRQATLIGTQLSGCKLEGAQLTGTTVREIQYDRKTVWPRNYSPPKKRRRQKG
ncbi:pentapeptide repeat-containing protein [Tsukamurella pseudospumae]|uniref:pentapeptide repeat-containing protein n=1 Tax=Tsukamurella pseudospumae TaxID=239498 RepID=UPI000B1D523F|nr:pentapeptide repeat-containing protein [Tsukamurella pseudospumae]